MAAAGSLALASATTAQVRFVDASATVPGNGTSWNSPYVGVENALIDVRSGLADTIYVAEGRYVPEIGALGTAVFNVPLGTRIFGGFRNGDPNEFSRTGDARATVLDGDITDDGPTMDDALHVITIDTTTGSDAVLLDGLHVTRGLAAGAAPADQQGGGILCIGADLTLRGCVFSQNAASRGGAIWFEGDGVADGFRAFDSIFFANTATETGGAIQLEEYGIPTTPSLGFTDEPSWIINCQFSRNLAGEPQTDSTALAAQGGGALFLGSRADERATIQTTTLAIANSRFTDNAVRGRGAAIRIESAPASSLTGRVFIANSTVAYNSILEDETTTTDDGGQIWVDGPEPQAASRPTITSSIVQFTIGGSNAVSGPGSVGTNPQGASPLSLVATYSNIELAGTTGVYGAASTNLDENPDFVNNAFRNFRLKVNSPCRNAGFVPAATSSTLVTVFPDYPDMDGLASANPANDPVPLDLFLVESRVQGGQIDMGCHEFRE